MDIDAMTQIAAAQVSKRRPGRPAGSRNYSALSHIARTMKENGISWTHELIDAYSLYKKQWILCIDDPARPAPDAKLLEFWMEILPYITVKLIDRETRGTKPKRVYKGGITPQAIAGLAKAEGRPV